MRYGQNEYGTPDLWRQWEPSSRSTAAKKEAIAQAGAAAASAREAKGDGPLRGVSEGPFRPLSDGPFIGSVLDPLNTASRGSVSEGPLRGSDLYPNSYEKESLALNVANASRTEPYEVRQGKTCARGEAGADALDEPLRYDGDPGPMSVDGYGFGVAPCDPDPDPVAVLCRYECAKAGECVEPGGVCVKRSGAACLPPAPRRRRSVSARGG